MKTYELIENIAELRIRIFGHDIKDIFTHALKAMFESISPQYLDHDQVVRHELWLSAPDREMLLMDFLAEALYYSDINNEAFFDVHFSELSEQQVKCTILGKKVLGFAIEIKSVTQKDISINKNNDQLSIDLLFDI